MPIARSTTSASSDARILHAAAYLSLLASLDVSNRVKRGFAQADIINQWGELMSPKPTSSTSGES